MISVQAVEPLLVPPVTNNIKELFDKYFDKIYLCDQDISEVEKEVNKHIFGLYGFNQSEIDFITHFGQ